MPSLHKDETEDLNDETRKATKGSFIRLTKGFTHYEYGNPFGDETVVLVHGFSVPYFIFDPLFDSLVENNFRVLRYDLFGRGFSDRPKADYNIDLFVEQLSELTNSLRFTQPFHLVGLSMGGPITASFVARYPDRVRSLTLIDPSGGKPITLSPLLKAAKIPLVAEAILRLVGGGGLVQSAAKDFFDPKLMDHFKDQYRVQMQFKGFQRALLSTLRNGMLESFIETYRVVGTTGMPVALFWGRDDKTVPIEQSREIRSAIPNLEFYVIEECGHIPHYEKPEIFNPLILEFFQTNKDVVHEQRRYYSAL